MVLRTTLSPADRCIVAYLKAADSCSKHSLGVIFELEKVRRGLFRCAELGFSSHKYPRRSIN